MPEPTTAQTANDAVNRPIRVLTPAILTIVSAACLFLAIPLTEGSFAGLMVMFYGPMLCALAFLIWWLFFSKTSWSERLLLLAAAILAGVAAGLLSHSSMVMALMIYGLPSLMLGWTLGLATFRTQPTQRMVAAGTLMAVAAGACTLWRIDGMTGAFNPEFAWRWTKTQEEEYLAARSKTKSTPVASAETLKVSEGDWPAFRGPNRDSVVRGAKIRADWKAKPPKELWRSKIGPGWSGLTVVGKYVFTQEQRGEEEAVVCLSLDDGKEVWSHVDKTRFMEIVAGPGPRATPTFHDGKLFTLGANGMLNAFDAATGKPLWKHDLTKETEATVPMWGFSASPQVYGDTVSVFGGAEKMGVVAYRMNDGSKAWAGGDGGHGYVSTHLLKIAGVELLLSTTSKGVQALDPATGKEVWRHDWPCGEVVRCVQPALLPGDRIAIGTAFGFGTRIFGVEKSGNEWKTNTVATHVAMKPYYNDFVLVGDEAYGFDGAVFSCVNLSTGKRHWRNSKYGSGQVLLLTEQKLLVVLAESGEVALVAAESAKFNELARFKAIAGKTWNHPTIAHGKLLVRNGEEIACYDVSP